MKNTIKSIFGVLFLSLLVSCGSTSGIRVTRDNITVLDNSGVGDDTTGEKRRIKASNEFANVEVEYETGTKNQSNTVGKIATGVITLEGIKLGREAIKEGSAVVSDLINQQ